MGSRFPLWSAWLHCVFQPSPAHQPLWSNAGLQMKQLDFHLRAKSDRYVLLSIRTASPPPSPPFCSLSLSLSLCLSLFLSSASFTRAAKSNGHNSADVSQRRAGRHNSVLLWPIFTTQLERQTITNVLGAGRHNAMPGTMSLKADRSRGIKAAVPSAAGRAEDKEICEQKAITMNHRQERGLPGQVPTAAEKKLIAGEMRHQPLTTEEKG